MFLYICIYLFVINYSSAFDSILNVNEINSVYYNVNILSAPVLKDRNSEVETVKLISKHGQEYICDIPAIEITAAEIKKYEESEEDHVDVSELLRPMEAAPCLVKRIHWWTYEFCYGSIIKQYHVEDNKVLGPILILGQYESEFNWKSGSETKNRLKRFHTQFYVNGTRCDINGNHRKTEVRFHCDVGASDYIRQVDEPESCRYVVVIGTSRVCHHPFLSKQLDNDPYRLNCSPTLTAEQLEKYNAVQDVKKARAEELKKENPAETESQNEEVTNSSSETKIDDDEIGINNESGRSSLPKDKKLIFTKENNPQMETEELPIYNKKPKNNFEDIFGQNDFPSGRLTKADFMKSSFKKVLDTIKEEMENYRTELMEEFSSDNEESAESDDISIFKRNMKIVKERVKNLDHAKTDHQFEEISEDIRTLLQKSLDSMLTLVKSTYPISDELQEELAVRVNDVKKMIHDFKNVQEESRDKELQEIFNAMISTLSLSEKHTEKVKDRLKELETNLKAEIDVLFNPRVVKYNTLDLLGESYTKDAVEKSDADKKNEKRKLQIIKDEKIIETRKLKLEQRIKERLIKHGLDGQKIEVQIITPTYMSDDKYPSLVALSPRDEEILIRIVNSNEEELAELENHKNLVENYNFQLEKILSSEEPSPEDNSESQSKMDIIDSTGEE